MKNFLLFLVLCGGAAGGWLLYQRNAVSPVKETSAVATAELPGAAGAGQGTKGKGGEGAAVPVISGEVQKKDMPLYLNGLGTVQGFNTVTVRSRVEGQLEKVFFTEGQEVKVGEVLAQIDRRPFQAVLDQALAKKKQDEALLANARRDLQRDLTLLSEKAGTVQKADTQQTLVEQLESQLKADDASIEAAQVQLDYTTLRSPIDGRTGIRSIDAGNVIHTNDSNGIVVVSQLRPISVVFTLPEQHLFSIQNEMLKGKLKVIALGRDNATPSGEGDLTVIDNQIDISTGTIRLKATFANEDLALWPGQFVNVRLKLSTREGAIVVPASVVQRGPIGTFAYVISATDTAELRPIKVARIEDGNAIIEEGLSPGERVVVDGQYRVQPGGKVRSADKNAGPQKVGEKGTPRH